MTLHVDFCALLITATSSSLDTLVLHKKLTLSVTPAPNSWLPLKPLCLSCHLCSSWLSVVESMPRPSVSQRGGLQSAPRYKLIGSQTLQAAAGKVCSQTSSRDKLGNGHFLPGSLYAEPRYIATGQGVLLNHLKYDSLCDSPVGLMNASPFDYQS